LIEFTGERVIPGQVESDLWSEHLARYAFARRFARGKNVLDAGCGTGYGSAELANEARSVTGIDLSFEAANYAAANYRLLPNLHFATASCEQLPFRPEAFDLVAGFEVIEHLAGYRAFVTEAARVLKPDGLFVVSTPNKHYYAETRAATGPNPYHQHEFEAEEFECELKAAFGHVCMMVQNRVASFAFYRPKSFWPMDARMDASAGSTGDAHFFIAICSQQPLPEMRSFAFIPKATNLLREREEHIRLLQQQVARARQDRDTVLELFRQQTAELEEHNRWAGQLNQQLGSVNARVVELQEEMAREQAAAVQVADAYETKVRELEVESDARLRWGKETEERLTAELQRKLAELADCVRLLDAAEATVTERTRWAQAEESRRHELEAILNQVRSSRWVKVGRQVGLGPAIQEP
jgi:ubiquinone/menaquinone biosynthesis C-methylase UbiE